MRDPLLYYFLLSTFSLTTNSESSTASESFLYSQSLIIQKDGLLTFLQRRNRPKIGQRICDSKEMRFNDEHTRFSRLTISDQPFVILHQNRNAPLRAMYGYNLRAADVQRIEN